MDNKALYKLSYGLYVLSTAVGDERFGCIINTAFQITSKPAQIAVSCNRDNFTHDKIISGKKFGLSVLAEDASQDVFSVFGYQSGKDIDKFGQVPASSGEALGVPLLSTSAVATFECRLVNQLEVGTHTIFIGEVVDCKVERPDSNEMTYRYYHEVRNGVAPKNAPTYIEDETSSDAAAEVQEKHVCSICGYVYDEELPFEDVDSSYVCPICRADKDKFS